VSHDTTTIREVLRLALPWPDRCVIVRRIVTPLNFGRPRITWDVREARASDGRVIRGIVGECKTLASATRCAHEAVAEEQRAAERAARRAAKVQS
jgi:hypothetical protein